MVNIITTHKETRIMTERQNGVVKWFDTKKGYGFIIPNDGGGDVFVHISAVEKSGYKTLTEKQTVNFSREENLRNGKTSAVDIAVI